MVKESKTDNKISLNDRVIDLNGDLSHQNLSGADLSGYDLSGRDLSGTDFTSASLQKANLQGADLTQAIFHNADLSHSNLIEAEFSCPGAYICCQLIEIARGFGQGRQKVLNSWRDIFG